MLQRLRHAALWSLAWMRGSGGKSASQRARAELLPATHARCRAAGRGRRGRRGRARQAHYTNRCRQRSMVRFSGEVRAKAGSDVLLLRVQPVIVL